MKSVSISLAFLLLLGVNLCATNPALHQRVSQERKVASFQRMELSTVAEVFFTQADQHSLRIEGEESDVNEYRSYVDNGTLHVKLQKEKKNIKEELKIFITAPRLDGIEFEGVGTLYINKPLKADNFDLDIEGVGKVYIKELRCRNLEVDVQGVGKADIHVECSRLKAEVDGIGSIDLSGQADYARIERSGIGSVNTRQLKVKQMDKN